MLEVNKVSKVFKNSWQRITAVDEVSFSIHEGEVFALVGESGSGKSTLAHMIMRLETPTSGHIRFGDIDIFAAPKGWRYHRKVQMIFQNPDSSLNPRMTVEQLILEPLVINCIPSFERKRKLQMLMDKVRLPFDLASRFPSELSGGQKQRVAIARALALNPLLLIADEATSSLDAVIERQVIDLLKDLHQDTGISILIITHNLDIVRSIADRVGVMQQGKLIEVGQTRKIFQSPQEVYTQQLLKAIPISHPKYRTSSMLEESGRRL
jgi:peptide/nickel transport system ATP-binding protein